MQLLQALRGGAIPFDLIQGGTIQFGVIPVELIRANRFFKATGKGTCVLMDDGLASTAPPADSGSKPTYAAGPATRFYLWFALATIVLITVLVTILMRVQRERLLLERQKIAQELALIGRLKNVDKLKDEFLAHTSHELRTPLNAIIGLAESLLDTSDAELSENARYCLKLIISSGRRLETLVNDIHDYSLLKNKSLVLDKKPVDLHALVDLILILAKPQLQGKPIRLSNDIPPELPAVCADENWLMQILQNLLNNAIKFTDEGSIQINARRDDKIVQISVTDTGVGIARDKFKDIFDTVCHESELQQKQQESGLGLSITKQLVELHGGKIWLESTLKEGTTFSFTLLLSQELPNVEEKLPSNGRRLNSSAPNHTSQAQLVTAEGAGREHILVVDDDAISRKLANNYLARHHYRVSEVDNGLDALEFIDRQGGVDLVLLDIVMPQMSGYETCKRLRDKYRIYELAIIFLTARDQLEAIVTGFDVGANDYLTKPIAKEELLLRVNLHLQLQRATRDLDKKVAERTEELRLRNEGLKETQQELQDAYRKLEQASLTDPLTGLYNRRFLNQSIGADIALVDREYLHWAKLANRVENGNLPPVQPRNQDLVFMLLDVDHFKWVNDEYGHGAGDKLLEQLGQLLRRALRDSDYLVRWGGEEFLLVGRFFDRSEAAEMAERIRSAVEFFEFDLGQGRRIHKSCSVGYAVYPFNPLHPNALTWEQVVDTADRALYIAKNSGRNCWVGIVAKDKEQDLVNPALSKNLGSLIAAGALTLESRLPLVDLELGE